MALLTFEQAKQYLSDPHACFKLVTSTRHVTLLPKYIGSVKAGIHDYLNSELNLSSKSLDGIPIAYNNVRRLQVGGHILDEAPSIHLNIQAEFIVFQPAIDSILKGVVNKISSGHVGCLVHGHFNASIPKPHGSNESWPGWKVQIGEEFLFRVLGTASQNGVLSMHGTFHESLSNDSIQVTKKGKKRKREDWEATEGDDLEIPGMHPKEKKRAKHSQSSTASSLLPMAGTLQASSQEADLGAPFDEQDATLNSCLDITDGAASHKKHKKRKKKKKEKHQHDDAMDVSANTEPGEDSTLDVMESEGRHKHRKKKKHKKDRGSSTFLNNPTAAQAGDLEDLSALNREGLDCADSPSDGTHDSGIMSIDSDTLFHKPHKKSKKKSKVQEFT